MPLVCKPHIIMALLLVASSFHLFLRVACFDITETDLLSRTMPSAYSLNDTVPSADLHHHAVLKGQFHNNTMPSADLLNSIMPSVDLTNSTMSSVDLLNSTMPNTTPDYLHGKHESLMNCTLIVLEPGEYELLSNGTLYVELYKMVFNESLFFVINDTAFICHPEIYENSQDEQQYYLIKTAHMTLIGLTISMICLFLHLVVFCLVPDLRNLPGWNLAALCTSLLFSYVLLIVSGEVQAFRDVCIAVALLSHFFLMSSFLWMSIMSFDVFMSLLRVTGSLRASSTQFKLKKFGVYSFCAFGIAFGFTLLGFLADILDTIPPAYKPRFEDTCWFSGKTPLLIFFAAPIIALTCLNLLFFVLSSYTIHVNKMKVDKDNQKSIFRRNYLLYFRLSVIMGITWVIGIVAAIGHTDWLWYLFVSLNTLQGLYIFLAFTCSEKVKKFFRLKFMGGRRSSEQTLSPTFQSYCFYANSIEKDLDKFVDSKAVYNKDKIDTIVIHL